MNSFEDIVNKKMNSIEDRLKIIMGELSGRKFASALGLATTTVNQYLNGRMPPADFIVLVCERFKIDSWWLLTGKGEINGSAKVGIIAETPIPFSTDRQTDILHHKLQRILEDGEKNDIEAVKVMLKAFDPGVNKQGMLKDSDPGAKQEGTTDEQNESSGVEDRCVA